MKVWSGRRGRMAMLSAAGLLSAAVWLPAGMAQSTQPAQQPAQPPPATQGDNPFPGEAQPAAPQPAKPQTSTPPTGTQTGTPAAKPGSDNPFPGEDTNAPVLPTGPGTAVPEPAPRPDEASDAGGNAPSNASSARRGDDPNGDPVRTPDPAGLQENDGFSSSRSGMPDLPVEDTTDAAPGKSVKNKTREQVIQEDVDVGSFYASKNNWKAAQARYTAAFGLDKENPDAVWGMAEAERHLHLYKEAAEHYQLFLTYDPDGPHGKAARKGLEEVESSLASGAGKEPSGTHN